MEARISKFARFLQDSWLPTSFLGFQPSYFADQLIKMPGHDALVPPVIFFRDVNDARLAGFCTGIFIIGS